MDAFHTFTETALTAAFIVFLVVVIVCGLVFGSIGFAAGRRYEREHPGNPEE